MGAEQQAVWLHSAVDALEDIRAAEVAAISMELRRNVTRPAQIVPEIAKLVGTKRRNTVNAGSMEAINADRVRQGLGAVHWVNGKCEFVAAPESSIGKRVK